MFDSTGTRYNFTVMELVETRKRLGFYDKREEGFDVSNVTFRLRVVDAGGAEVEGCKAEHGANKNGVRLYVPAIEAGSYDYELVARAESGEEDVIVSGVLTARSRAAGDKIVKEAQSAAESELRVLVPDEVGRPLVLKWGGGSFAEGYVEAAQEAAERAEGSAQEAAREAAEAKEAKESVRGLVENVETLQATLAMVEGRIRSAIVINPKTNTWWVGGYDTGTQATGDPGKSPRISDHNTWELYDPIECEWHDSGAKVSGDDGKSPYVDSEGYWVDVDPLTGEYRRTELTAHGRDGIDGASVRRIVVGGVEEIPQEGETCIGGVYYYVPLSDALPVAIFTPGEEREGEGVAMVNRRSVQLPSRELGAAEAAEAFAGSLRAVFPEAAVEVDPENNAVMLIADVAYWQVQGLPEGEWGLTLHVRMKRDGYDVYAWLESADGNASWVRVGEANDLATAEIYGLTKLGTGRKVQGGAPVGVREDGGMAVPRAEWLVAGSVLPGEDGRVAGGAGVGFDEGGRMRVREADGGNYGVVMTSYSGVAEVPVVGRMADGRLGLPWANLNQAGAVRLGSVFGQGNPIPYKIGIGADEGHHLANNLLYAGAWKHMSPSSWRALELPWLTQAMDEHPEWFTDAYYGGLHTSLQFKQSMEEGLELLSATASMVGGVRLAVRLDEEGGEEVVPTAKVTLDYLHENYYDKNEALTKKAAADIYLTKRAAADTYLTQEKFREERQQLDEGIEGCVKKTKQWIGNVYLTEEEYNALDEVDPQVEYNILGNSH